MHDLIIRGGTVVDGTGSAPRTADVAIDDGTVAEVGRVAGPARRTIDADGLVVTPGWIDVHTHYDGQALWDPDLTPSSWHGVTTAVMGNCGVGFAPMRPDGRELLIELMEAVEDIPTAALEEGLAGSWESFEDFLDVLDSSGRAIDLAAQVPHVALRTYVMGERAHGTATAEDIATMGALAERALRAGACGISTSRTVNHSSPHGYVPGTAATVDELFALGRAIARAGHGVFQLNSDHKGDENDRAWTVAFVELTGRPLVYILSQSGAEPERYRNSLASAARDLAAGRPIIPQVSNRPVGMLFGLQTSLHPFITHPTWVSLERLSHADRVARLREPEVRQALLSETYAPDDHRIRERVKKGSWQRWERMFPLGDPPDYEPAPSMSVAAIAAREHRSPAEVALDLLLDRDGAAFLYAPVANFADGDHDAILEMITCPGTVVGLSDAGAHLASVSDASTPTFMLTHWVKGRTRGARLPLEQAVHLQTGRAAQVWGFADRGVLAPGLRADINVIDLDRLALRAPQTVFDLPTGAKRLIQRADGYVATLVRGEVTFENGEATGRRPGRVVRF